MTWRFAAKKRPALGPTSLGGFRGGGIIEKVLAHDQSFLTTKRKKIEDSRTRAHRSAFYQRAGTLSTRPRRARMARQDVLAGPLGTICSTNRKPHNLRKLHKFAGKFKWQVHHDVMTTRHFGNAPSWQPSYFGGVVAERAWIPTVGEDKHAFFDCRAGSGK